MLNFILEWVLFLWFFDFFWTDNDLVYAPPPESGTTHYGDTTMMPHILRRIAQKLLSRFSWNFGTLFQTI